MPRPRLTDWIATDPSISAKASASPTMRDLGPLLAQLRSGAPNQWSQNILELSRHFTDAAFLAINTLAKHAMDSTFVTYERTDDPDSPNGETVLPWYDPIHQTFENPNDVDTFADLMYQDMQQRGLTGISLTWTVPSDRDEPREIYNLPTACCLPMPAGYQGGFDYPHGAYRVMPYPFGMTTASAQASAGAIIPAEQIHRTKNHHPFLKSDGYAVLSAISQHVDTFEAIGKSRFATMQQGCEQSLSLKSSSPMSADPTTEDLGRLRTQFEALYAGPKNAGKVLIPPVGWEIAQISTVPKDMAWSEGWSQVLDFILASFGVPKAVAGLQEATSYATLYAALRAFCLLSLGPEVRKVARVWTKHIVQPSWGREYGIRINAPEFTDEQLQENRISNDLKAGILKNKELRRIRKYDHLDEPWLEDRAIANYSPQAANGGGDGGRTNEPEQSKTDPSEDPNVNNARPASKSQRLGVLLNALEKAKTNGHALPTK